MRCLHAIGGLGEHYPSKHFRGYHEQNVTIRKRRVQALSMSDLQIMQCEAMQCNAGQGRARKGQVKSSQGVMNGDEEGEGEGRGRET